MTVFNAKIDTDSIKNDDDRQAFLDLIAQHPSTKKGARIDSISVMNVLIHNYAQKVKKDMTTGVTGKISNRINEAVNAQIEVNRTSNKYIVVGSGDNAERVYFERKALTPKQIANLGGFNLNSVKDWLKDADNANLVNAHNAELGLTNKDDMNTFNLKAGRSNRTANSNPSKVQEG